MKGTQQASQRAETKRATEQSRITDGVGLVERAGGVRNKQSGRRMVEGWSKEGRRGGAEGRWSVVGERRAIEAVCGFQCGI